MLPYLGEAAPQGMPLSEVAQFSVDEFGNSQRAMQRLRARISAGGLRIHLRRAQHAGARCLSLMLPTGLLYVPVLEDEARRRRLAKRHHVVPRARELMRRAGDHLCPRSLSIGTD